MRKTALNMNFSKADLAGQKKVAKFNSKFMERSERAAKSKALENVKNKYARIANEHARIANEVNAKNRAHPKRYKQYLEESASAAAENRGGNEN